MFIENQIMFDESLTKTEIDIEEIVKSKLPSLPGAAMRVLGILRDSDAPPRKLAEAISCDPSLTTRVLRLANSPIYALQKSVSSLPQAVEIVGTKYLYDIVIMNLTSVAFAEEIRTLTLAKTVWEHSLAVALLARDYCRTLKMTGADEVFVCGLLHDIGKIMLLRVDAETYAEIAELANEKEIIQREINAFGCSHPQLGSLVARRWQLPENICAAIYNHHNAAQSVEAVIISHLINVADMVANFHNYGLRREKPEALTNIPSAIVLQLTDRQIHQGWENIQPDLIEVAQTFR